MRPPLILTTLLAAGLVIVTAVLAPPAFGDADAGAEQPSAPPLNDERTRAVIDAVLAKTDLPSAFWGVYAQDLRSGRVVVSRNAEKLFMPASTLKLATVAAALDVLGPDHRFVTRLYHFGTAADGTLRGDLVIRGDGDPTFGSEWIEQDPLATWAAALAAKGVRRIEGRIIGDDDRFSDVLYPEGWDVTHIGTESYAPATSGLSWGDNLIEVTITGGGTSPSVSLSPAGALRVENRLVSGSRRAPLRIDRPLGSDRLLLEGAVSARFAGDIELPVTNPTRYAVLAFVEALRNEGITVDAEALDADDLSEPLSYGDQKPLRATVSPRLSEIAERILRRSDNLYAEHVLRALTPDGDLDGATGRVEAFLRRVGATTGAIQVVDGSGLSRKNLVTPQSMGALLAAMTEHPAGDVFRAVLPAGGTEESTLEYRLRNVPLRAKTGSISYVRALAGYLTNSQGHPMVFAILTNHYTTGSGAVIRAQDRIVEALATGGRVDLDE